MAGLSPCIKEAREFGVTSVQVPGAADFEAYVKLQKDGELTCRIDIGKSLTGDTARLKRYLELERRYPRDETG